MHKLKPIGIFYDVNSKEALLRKIRDIVDYWLFLYQPLATDSEIMEFIERRSLEEGIKLETLREFFRKNLEISRNLATDPGESEPETYARYVKFYERVLKAFDSKKISLE